MGSTCSQLLELCLGAASPEFSLSDVTPWSAELLREALAVDEGREFLSVVVEKLGDLFEPSLCDVYARVFSQAVAEVVPSTKAREMEERYRRVRAPRPAPDDPADVYVLSRVTLGADVAVTSVVLDAAKKRYPEARIHFVAPPKNFELFEADPRIEHVPAPYARSGSLKARLDASMSLRFDDTRSIVLDPDSRLSQLGLILPIAEERYFLFDSRAYGGDRDARLPELASRWCAETLGVEGARPFVAPKQTSASADIAVSLGVGENPSKRFDDDFERRLLAGLASIGASMLVDLGGTPEERDRVRRALPAGAEAHDGSFASFAARVARAKLFVGYDSAGGHVASACGVPQVCVFRGEVSERMFQRWRPQGLVLRGDSEDCLARALTYARETL